MEFVVKSEKDAFELIKKALSKELGQDVQLQFENWPQVTVKLDGDGYDSTITPSLMDGLVELQKGLNRTYAKLVHDQPNATHLKEAERQALEFKAKVRQGSSIVEINLADFAQKLVTDLAAKMEPSHVVVLGVVGATLWAATSMYKGYLNTQAKKSEINVDADKLVKLSEQETERLRLVTEAIRVEPRLGVIAADASATSVAMLKGVSDAQHINLNGVSLINSEAKALVKSERVMSEEGQLNGDYRILVVDVSKEDEFRIRVRYVPDGREFWAKFTDNSLKKEHVQILRDAMWSDGRTVYLSVNVNLRRGEVTGATIVSARQQPLV